MELTPSASTPAKFKQICSRLGRQSCHGSLPLGGSWPDPLKHTMLWPRLKKHQHSLPTTFPTTTRPHPPLPGKCDAGWCGGVGVGATPTPPPGSPEQTWMPARKQPWPAGCTDSFSGLCRGVAQPYSHSFHFLRGCAVTSVGLGLCDLG